MEELDLAKKRIVAQTLKNSSAVGVVGALLIALISKHVPDQIKDELILVVPFLSVWLVALGNVITSCLKWLKIAYGPEEPSIVKIRRLIKKRREKLTKELNSASTSAENRKIIRKKLDELQLEDLDTYDIK